MAGADGTISTMPENPEAAADNFELSEIAPGDVNAWNTDSPRHVPVGPVPSVQPDGFVHVRALPVSGKLKTTAKSFCDAVSVGVVYDVLLLM